MSPASSKADFQGSPEPPPMAGIYWFQSEGTSTVLRLPVTLLKDVFTVSLGYDPEALKT
jgi:hypothetical protein